jgi:hypothetical protein
MTRNEKIILALLAIGVYLHSWVTWKSRPITNTTTTISIDSSRVTNNYTQEQLTQYHRSTDTLEIPANVDTAAILRLFHQSHFYRQSIRDTVADVLAEISDTVRFNMLTYRSVNLRNLRTTQVITTVYDTCKPYKPPFLQPYVGARVGISRQTTLQATPFNNGGRIGITRPLISQATPFIGVKIKGRWHADYGYNLLGKEHQISVARDIFGTVPAGRKK